MADKLRIYVCQHYILEARAVLRGEGLDDVEVAPYKDLCVHPSTSERQDLIEDLDLSDDEDSALIGLCFLARKGRSPEKAAIYPVKRGETCFSLFAPHPMIQQQLDRGAYLLTPGWVQDWESRLGSWGFDKQTAREFFKESSTRLVLLDTGVLPGAWGRLEELASHLDLPCEKIDLGLDHFRLHLEQAALRWRAERQGSDGQGVLKQARRRLADHAMVLDLLASLARTMSEEDAVEAILDLFSMIMGAKSVLYIPMDQGRPGVPRVQGGERAGPETAARLLKQLGDEAGYARIGPGFCVRVSFQDEELGVLAVADLSFPRRQEEYMNLALAMSRVCGLVITNARSESLRRQTHQALESKSAELERSNAELSQFAYAVSHDLKEPLRTISGFIQLLAERYGDKLDDRAAKYFDFTVDGAARMRRLIDDLLLYSRVGTHGLEFEQVDLGAVLDDVRGNLNAALEEAGARLSCDDLPMVLGDPSQMSQLLQNLVSNGIKFRGEAPPEVHVGALRQDSGWLISVADNGIGMRMEDAERIFKIFQRLHGRSRYEGTGIGLSVCKRIVERHGGKIWVESSPGEGATFHFSLPGDQLSKASRSKAQA